MKNLIKIIDNFNGKKIGVVGDVILDHFIRGDVERISPEAPVPVVSVKGEDFIPGGSANTANNIAALGGLVSVVGIIGSDSAGEKLVAKLNEKRINAVGLIIDKKRSTIQKVRVVANGQQVVRFDRETTDNISVQQEKKAIAFVSQNIKDWDGVVISDYNKGFVTDNLAKEIIKLAKKFGKPIIGDTKPEHASYFKNIDLLTPNNKEAVAMAGTKDIKKAGVIIQKQLNCNVLIKRGPQGMTLFEGSSVKNFPTKAREIFDVVGAGDTVAATIILALVSGASLSQAAIIANYAAGIVVGKPGTAVVNPEELRRGLMEN